MWYKFTKKFQGGVKYDYYFLKEGEDIVEQCKLFGERSDGGHNYGYQLSYDESPPPPKEWAERELKYTDILINSALSNLKECVERKQFLKNLL